MISHSRSYDVLDDRRTDCFCYCCLCIFNYKTGRFHVAVRVFTYRSQKTSKTWYLRLSPRLPLFLIALTTSLASWLWWASEKMHCNMEYMFSHGVHHVSLSLRIWQTLFIWHFKDVHAWKYRLHGTAWRVPQNGSAWLVRTLPVPNK